MTNKLFYGDNLDVLREQFAADSVDLIYLDPPFNSNANYNILFKSKTGKTKKPDIPYVDQLSAKRAQREDMGKRERLL